MLSCTQRWARALTLPHAQLRSTLRGMTADIEAAVPGASNTPARVEVCLKQIVVQHAWNTTLRP